MAKTLFMHYGIHHYMIHHKYVGTELDPVCPKKGMSLWAYIANVIPK